MHGSSVAIFHHSARLVAALLDRARAARSRAAARPVLELARGQLDEVALLRIAVLALEEDRLGVDEREHHHRARVHHVLAPGLARRRAGGPRRGAP